MARAPLVGMALLGLACAPVAVRRAAPQLVLASHAGQPLPVEITDERALEAAQRVLADLGYSVAWLDVRAGVLRSGDLSGPQPALDQGGRRHSFRVSVRAGLLAVEADCQEEAPGGVWVPCPPGREDPAVVEAAARLARDILDEARRAAGRAGRDDPAGEGDQGL